MGFHTAVAAWDEAVLEFAVKRSIPAPAVRLLAYLGFSKKLGDEENAV